MHVWGTAVPQRANVCVRDERESIKLALLATLPLQYPPEPSQPEPSNHCAPHVSAGHSNDAEEATDTSRSARASRRDVAGQPEPPEALDSSVGAAGTPAAHPLRRESAASYFEEAQLFKTRARV